MDQKLKMPNQVLSKKKQIGVQINGIIFNQAGEIHSSEFLDNFMKWVESENMTFCGSVGQVDEDGNPINI